MSYSCGVDILLLLLYIEPLLLVTVLGVNGAEVSLTMAVLLLCLRIYIILHTVKRSSRL